MGIKNIKNQQEEVFLQNLEKSFMVSNGVYADNFLNRKLGRVGQPYKKGDKEGKEDEELKMSEYLRDLPWHEEKTSARGGIREFDAFEGKIQNLGHGKFKIVTGSKAGKILDEKGAYNFIKKSEKAEKKFNKLLDKDEKKFKKREQKEQKKKDKEYQKYVEKFKKGKAGAPGPLRTKRTINSNLNPFQS